MAKVGVGGDAQRSTYNNTSGYDPASTGYVQGIRNAGVNAAMSGPGSLLTGASGFYTGAMNGGNLGFGALSGDPAATAKLMNPYISNVIDANNAQWQRINQNTINAVDDRATLAHAFGGSRHGVAEGVALGQNNLAQAGQNAGLLNQGFSDMQNRAGLLAGLGFQGAGANANLGFAGVGNPNLWILQMLKQGWTGPTGQMGSGAQSGTSAKGSASFGVG